MTRTRTLTIALIILLSGCAADLHIIHWDYIPGAGWYTHQPRIECMIDCFDPYGNVLSACQGCFDANKRLIPGCTPGHYNVAPEKAEIDAKINAKFTEDHCRLTAYGCACTAQAWTGEQKKVYPACDPSVPSKVAAKGGVRR